jgi:N-acyl-D-glutamate deacylase
LIVLLASSAACAQTYDLVISGGRVIDPESRLDAVRNVGIRDGKVAVISRGKLAGNRVIDAKGLVVAPGFIDLHSHAVMALPAARMQVMDGVTTALELESGVLSVAATYDLLAKEGRPLNYGFSVAWTFARASIAMGKPARDFSTADWGPTVVPIGKDFTNRTNRVAFLKSSSWAYGRARSAAAANLGYMPNANIDEGYEIARLTLKYGGTRTFYYIRHKESAMSLSMACRS